MRITVVARNDTRTISRRRASLLPQRRLRCGEPRDRHAEGRAGDVVEPNTLAERDTRRIAAMFAANPEFDRRPRRATALGRQLDQLADAFLIDRHERIGRQDAAGRIDAEKGRRIVARDAERRLSEVVGAEGEELRALSNVAGT